MLTYQLSILSPEGQIFDAPVESLTAPGQLGSFGILARHAPMVTALKIGVLNVKEPHRQQFFAIGDGVLEVDHAHDVIILADYAHAYSTQEDAKNHLAELKR